MSKKAMEDLREMMCKELDEIAKKNDLSAGDLETAHKLTDTIKNIDKIKCLEYDGYSRDGDWTARGTYRNGNSYATRHWVRGHYSRDGNSGRYSMAGREDMAEKLRDMADDESLSYSERSALWKAMDAFER